MQRIPSLKLLIGFEAAARLGNFSRAADELHLSQSAISHQIQQLEEQLGQPLFRRVGRGVELTVGGDVLLRTVQRSLDTLRSGLGRIGTYLTPGLVVIVCPAPLLHGWLQPRLARMRQDIPELCPLLSTDETARYVDEIDVDITIGQRPLMQPGLLEIPFLQDERVTVCAPELAARLDALPLDRHPLHAGLVCLEEDIVREASAAILREQLATFEVKTIHDDQRLALDAALRGHGIACLPSLLVEDSVKQGSLKVLAGYPRLPGASWWISRVAGTPRSQTVADVFGWLCRQGNRDGQDGA
ncbi:LysR family transcriptional regulator [Burkholderia ubonensis]|uniref:LysR family transcriptional regulator n=1 Tax=Burkholderia ubonensis subsp. mesacidophila TaxID=265293 RepID=A0A2A4FMZ2_9BURK|nr:LysR family transcriptional regulator [Burkholderia ubonensis]PCE34030.1 LysR family transcriptional regulator [Burkholderia ubonensis subsp. mesacidophila]